MLGMLWCSLQGWGIGTPCLASAGAPNPAALQDCPWRHSFGTPHPSFSWSLDKARQSRQSPAIRERYSPRFWHALCWLQAGEARSLPFWIGHGETRSTLSTEVILHPGHSMPWCHVPHPHKKSLHVPALQCWTLLVLRHSANRCCLSASGMILPCTADAKAHRIGIWVPEFPCSMMSLPVS